MADDHHISDGEIVEEGEILESDTSTVPQPIADEVPIRNGKRKSATPSDSEDESHHPEGGSVRGSPPAKVRRVGEAREDGEESDGLVGDINVSAKADAALPEQIVSPKAEEKESSRHRDKHRDKKKRSSRHKHRSSSRHRHRHRSKDRDRSKDRCKGREEHRSERKHRSRSRRRHERRDSERAEVQRDNHRRDDRRAEETNGTYHSRRMSVDTVPPPHHGPTMENGRRYRDEMPAYHGHPRERPVGYGDYRSPRDYVTHEDRIRYASDIDKHADYPSKRRYIRADSAERRSSRRSSIENEPQDKNISETKVVEKVEDTVDLIFGEEDEERLIEERRKRRQAILQKHKSEPKLEDTPEKANSSPASQNGMEAQGNGGSSICY